MHQDRGGRAFEGTKAFRGASSGRGSYERERDSRSVPIPGERPGRPPPYPEPQRLFSFEHHFGTIFRSHSFSSPQFFITTVNFDRSLQLPSHWQSVEIGIIVVTLAGLPVVIRLGVFDPVRVGASLPRATGTRSGH